MNITYTHIDKSWNKVRHVDCKGGSSSSNETDQSTSIETNTTTNLSNVQFGPTDSQVASISSIATNAQNNATAQITDFNRNVALPSLQLNAQNLNSLIDGATKLIGETGSVGSNIINDSSDRASEIVNLASKVATGTELTSAKFVEVMGMAIPIIGALFAISLAVRNS